MDYFSLSSSDISISSYAYLNSFSICNVVQEISFSMTNQKYWIILPQQRIYWYYNSSGTQYIYHIVQYLCKWYQYILFATTYDAFRFIFFWYIMHTGLTRLFSEIKKKVYDLAKMNNKKEIKAWRLNVKKLNCKFLRSLKHSVNNAEEIIKQINN